jgi:hypothetical protein
MKRWKPLYERNFQGDLYHFTNVYSLFEILKTNKMISESDDINGNPIISFTRNPDLTYAPLGDEKVRFGDIRIVIDGTKLSRSKYKLNPYNDYAHEDNFKKLDLDLSEESVFTEEIKPIIPFIKKISLLEKDTNYVEQIEKYNIPVEIVNNFKKR